LKLDARSAEVQALIQSAVIPRWGLSSGRRTSTWMLSCPRPRTARSPPSPRSTRESHAACEARRLALESEVARAAERSTDQFRKGMKASYTPAGGAVSAVDDIRSPPLEGSSRTTGRLCFEAEGDSRHKDDPEILPDTDTTHSPTKNNGGGAAEESCSACRRNFSIPAKKKANRSLSAVGSFRSFLLPRKLCQS